MFASQYINKNIVYPPFIGELPADRLGLVVVIPCFREPAIEETLASLARCDKPTCGVEVIVVVNEPETAPEEVRQFNRDTFVRLQQLKAGFDTPSMRLFPIYPPSFRRKFAGAGMARKVGMDEAIRRFGAVARPDGLIVSLDADTTVAVNYFTVLERFLKRTTSGVAATLRFSHRIQPETMSGRQVEGIRLYERYLHYYRKALAYTGYPVAIHTIGSAFAVRADAYVRQGGMNRKQAGEDFYFLHKISQLGQIAALDDTCVYPLARFSDRVPFGTGPVLQRWVDGAEDLTYTYHFQAFRDLKQFFDRWIDLYKITEDAYSGVVLQMPLSVRAFLAEDQFWTELQVVCLNSGSPEAFQKRFFQVFNAFKILKYINFVHMSFYPKQALAEAEDALGVAMSG